MSDGHFHVRCGVWENVLDEKERTHACRERTIFSGWGRDSTDDGLMGRVLLTVPMSTPFPGYSRFNHFIVQGEQESRHKIAG